MWRFSVFVACLLAAVLLAAFSDTVVAQYGTFDFDDGTVQGWTLAGAYDENGNGPFSHYFSLAWQDLVNYPNFPLTDPGGDSQGSLQMFTPGGHGINNPAGTWWIMQFHSPDLSGSNTWQTATGYTVEIADVMSVGGTLYSNLYVRVYDIAQARDRYFYSGTAQPIQHYQTTAWNYLSFDDWSAIPGFPTNYTVREVFVNIWGLMTDLIEGAVYLDEVMPISNPPVLSVTPTTLDFGTSLDNLDFYVSNVGGGTLTWNVIETPDKPWITSLSPSSGSNGATVTVAVDRTYLSGDSDSGTLAVTSNGGSQDIAVLIARETYITVTSPAAGAEWYIGDDEHIQWSSTGTSGNVMIEISRDGGDTWSTLEGGITDVGDYTWPVTGPASSNCQVRVSDVDGTPSGSSDTFTISEEPYITVTSPAAGAQWYIGTEEHVQWSSSGVSEHVMIEISRDGGGTWSTIEGSTTDDGDYVWTVTGPASLDCNIRVTDTDGTPSGASDWFTISEEPYITVTSPAAGAQWYIGTEEHVQWSSSSVSENVMIEISRDGGGTWSTIVLFTPNNGDCPWPVVGPASLDCQIRVSELDGSLSGSSGTFIIAEIAAEDPPLPGSPTLEVTGPSPCTGLLTVTCSVPEAGAARVGVYDLHGRLVKKLHGGPLGAGRWTFRWNPEDGPGATPVSGVYLCRLEACGRTVSRSFILLR